MKSFAWPLHQRDRFGNTQLSHNLGATGFEIKLKSFTNKNVKERSFDEEIPLRAPC